jgi:hypothetical protein
MLYRVKDLSPEQRQALEGLLGRRLREDEGLNIQPTRVLQEAPTGEERTRAYRQYLEHIDKLAARAENVSEAELNAIIDEACDHAGHS